jgi:hypothetical protein
MKMKFKEYLNEDLNEEDVSDRQYGEAFELGIAIENWRVRDEFIKNFSLYDNNHIYSAILRELEVSSGGSFGCGHAEAVVDVDGSITIKFKDFETKDWGVKYNYSLITVVIKKGKLSIKVKG